MTPVQAVPGTVRGVAALRAERLGNIATTRVPSREDYARAVAQLTRPAPTFVPVLTTHASAMSPAEYAATRAGIDRPPATVAPASVALEPVQSGAVTGTTASLARAPVAGRTTARRATDMSDSEYRAAKAALGIN